MGRSYGIGEIADIQAISNVLACHSRGVDRADAGLLASCYHDGGTVDYRFFAGPAAQFAAILTEGQKQQPVTLHRTAQMWIELDGDRAQSESHVMAYAASADEAGQPCQRLICGRYLDRHERRHGEWRLTHRTYVLDTNVNWRGDWTRPDLGPLESQAPIGGHGAADAGIALLAQARARNNTEGAETMSHDEGVIDAVISRQQIADLTMAYCRGVDRADAAILAEVFHEDATVVSGVFNGNARDFATQICTLVEEVYEQTFHSIANQWIEVDGDGAIGETYVIAVSTSRGDGEPTDTLTGGRYIDRFERRGGRWAIAERTFVLDWMRNEPTTRQMEGGMYGALDLRGCRGAADPVYAFLRG
ncbi:nuclear transport factor 2 family protein [Novosphingobium sp. JCM 18896]|uniref:nuclear transport factor 2 family protein n=1 Tax=Novosphingobium sp. JCM 18896 TaxID=2989731 RepID=UPI002223BBB4|nr:nuclear transport factor 2 family protein [Novosphingobium sp. JCM 18896]MCW1427808.1 nuclear transport factor 2 family protein [Novosphingobium sp. JCM 18896]